MGALAADDSAVVAVQEADELEPALLGLGHDLVGCHRTASIGAGDDGEPPVPGWTPADRRWLTGRSGYGDGTFTGTTSPPRVSAPFSMSMTVTPFWGTWLPGAKVILPVMPGKSLVASMAALTAAESVPPARLMASTSR